MSKYLESCNNECKIFMLLLVAVLGYLLYQCYNKNKACARENFIEYGYEELTRLEYENLVTRNAKIVKVYPGYTGTITNTDIATALFQVKNVDITPCKFDRDGNRLIIAKKIGTVITATTTVTSTPTVESLIPAEYKEYKPTVGDSFNYNKMSLLTRPVKRNAPIFILLTDTTGKKYTNAANPNGIILKKRM